MRDDGAKTGTGTPLLSWEAAYAIECSRRRAPPGRLTGRYAVGLVVVAAAGGGVGLLGGGPDAGVHGALAAGMAACIVYPLVGPAYWALARRRRAPIRRAMRAAQ